MGYKGESLMDCGYFYCPYIVRSTTEGNKMSDTTVLRERNPETAEFVDSWRSKYERDFDLSDQAEQATFYEGIVEMARHIATAAGTVSLAAMLNTDGVSQVSANAVPPSSERSQDD